MASKSKRIKSSSTSLITITDWEGADELVKKIGTLQLNINQAELIAKERIDMAKQDLAKTIKPFQDEIKKITQSLEIFATANRTTAFGRNQSKKLNFGKLGWRKSMSISIAKTTLDKIKQVFGKKKAVNYIHTKEVPDKEALAKLTDEQLTSLGARRKNKEVFFVEPDLPEAVDYE